MSSLILITITLFNAPLFLMVYSNCIATDVLAPYKKIGTKRKAD